MKQQARYTKQQVRNWPDWAVMADWARRIGVSRQTLSEWRKTGRLTSRKLESGLVAIDKASIVKALGIDFI